ncbi:hypothetical protein DERF_012160 [Dermatophagoides farinae]|uniref:Uncharacterized protein n=1 Tax=Dermatophagoides farinae TaxID=6954 RepID=A0A922KWV8_DERFA|nr:hypothetical protein DERF_012160 [Dermatophagoides farinae]
MSLVSNFYGEFSFFSCFTNNNIHVVLFSGLRHENSLHNHQIPWKKKYFPDTNRCVCANHHHSKCSNVEYSSSII